MANMTLRLPDDLYEKLRWLAYQERRSQHSIVIQILEEGLKNVQVPEEQRK